MLPEIRSRSEVYGETASGRPGGVPIAGDLGDQQAATFGQACLSVGEAKNTYGTGNFMLLNTGTQKVPSKNGLLTTVCYKIGDGNPVYALEGSIAVTGFAGAVVARQPRMIRTAPEIEDAREDRPTTGAPTSCPRSRGLFAPYWRSDARGAIVGLTRYVNKGHLARAMLEATAFQTREVLDAMNADSGVDADDAEGRRRHGRERTLMQFQADILGVPVIRRWSPRPPRSARPTRPAWRSASGPPRTTSARTGPRTSSGNRPWTTRTGEALPQVAQGGHEDPSTGWTMRLKHRIRLGLSVEPGSRVRARDGTNKNRRARRSGHRWPAVERSATNRPLGGVATAGGRREPGRRSGETMTTSARGTASRPSPRSAA